jgi:cytoskeletal protein CcmA (bactofilin family)
LSCRDSGVLAEKGNDMLGSFKAKAIDNDHATAAPAVANVMGAAGQPQRPAVEQPAPSPAPEPETICSIGSGTSIVGNIVCDGPAHFYGRIEGEVRGSDLLIGDGAQVVGNVIAEEVTIRGRIKGTIRAVRVKLQSGGAVEGDIFYRSLSIEDGSLFEGSSKRVENPIDTPSSVPVKGPDKENQQTAARPQLASADAKP